MLLIWSTLTHIPSRFWFHYFIWKLWNMERGQFVMASDCFEFDHDQQQVRNYSCCNHYRCWHSTVNGLWNVYLWHCVCMYCYSKDHYNCSLVHSRKVNLHKTNPKKTWLIPNNDFEFMENVFSSLNIASLFSDMTGHLWRSLVL